MATMNSPRIVVIGGSFAGTRVIAELETLLPSAQITLIEKREAFYNSVASIRTLVEPGYAAKIWVPYTKLFTKNPLSRVLRDVVVDVDVGKGVVRTAGGVEVVYEFLVVCSGTRLPAPAKTDKVMVGEGVKEAEEIVEKVRGAKKGVVVVGGGVIGVEFVGELATDYPTLPITLIHSGPTLLHTTAQATDALRARLLSNLKAFPNVTIHFNERVVSELPEKGYTLISNVVKTDKGREVESDVLFCATGVQVPNSEFLRGVKGVLDERGFVKTRKTGQVDVEGVDNVFALGDVATLDEFKVAYATFHQGPLIAKNIHALATSSAAPLLEYKPIPTNNCALVVSTGRNGGCTQLPYLGVFGNNTTWFFKSAGLFVAKTWSNLHVGELMPE
ncbi:Apoptosis-inducing factor 2 [Phlyctochytrium planicorne]|nr:Apoptosis-inducing factor 2 [Phlyctochytrium planicorne]